MFFGFLENAATGAPAAGGLATLMQIVPFILIIAIFYFMLIRPQKKKEKQTQAMLNAVQVGDDVVTIGGIYGTVVRIKDDKLFIETSKQEKTMIEIARWGIKDVLKYVEDK